MISEKHNTGGGGHADAPQVARDDATPLDREKALEECARLLVIMGWVGDQVERIGSERMCGVCDDESYNTTQKEERKKKKKN